MENRIVVVGSCSSDFTSYAPRLPKEGETLMGTKFEISFGGKGANQCVAAAKLGGNTYMVARVGDDLWGERYVKHLKETKVDTTHVNISKNCTSGIAQINVSDNGANQIVIIPGANGLLTTEDVKNAEGIINTAAVLVCQLETSTDVAIHAIELCGGISILNGAPAMTTCDLRLFTLPTIFCVNEVEASMFSGVHVESKNDANAAIKSLLEKGCNTVIITLGSQGAMFASKGNPTPQHVASKQVICVETTGAGDAFIGALAFLLANRKELDLKDCIAAACLVAADSVTKPGTQASFPDAFILEKLFL